MLREMVVRINPKTEPDLGAHRKELRIPRKFPMGHLIQICYQKGNENKDGIRNGAREFLGIIKGNENKNRNRTRISFSGHISSNMGSQNKLSE